MSFIRSQEQAELHKTTSIVQESVTNQIFYRQTLFSVKSFGVEEKGYIAQKAFETGHMPWFSEHTQILTEKTSVLIKTTSNRQKIDKRTLATE